MVGCVPATATEPGIFRWDDMQRIADRISEIKAKCRWCVVIAHGGEEFSAMPLPNGEKAVLTMMTATPDNDVTIETLKKVSRAIYDSLVEL
jgi:hypothetical protein